MSKKVKNPEKNAEMLTHDKSSHNVRSSIHEADVPYIFAAEPYGWAREGTFPPARVIWCEANTVIP
jgi:hypothetical protein